MVPPFVFLDRLSGRISLRCFGVKGAMPDRRDGRPPVMGILSAATFVLRQPRGPPGARWILAKILI
jgi:hypothetical protein